MDVFIGKILIIYGWLLLAIPLEIIFIIFLLNKVRIKKGDGGEKK